MSLASFKVSWFRYISMIVKLKMFLTFFSSAKAANLVKANHLLVSFHGHPDRHHEDDEFNTLGGHPGHIYSGMNKLFSIIL